MATKITCDGCDSELKKPTRRDEKVDGTFNGVLALTRNGHSVFCIEDLDLCKGCVSRLERDADPRRWARAAKPFERPDFR